MKYNVYAIKKEDRKKLKDTSYDFTYGELTKSGVRQLNEYILRFIVKKKENVFYDLGAGNGKLLIEMEKVNKSFNKLIGIEMVEERVENGNKLIKKVKSKIELLEDDICNRNYQNASVIYISNLCFPDTLNRKIGEKLSNEVKENTLIFASKPIYITRCHTLKMIKVNQSWCEKSDLLLMIINQ